MARRHDESKPGPDEGGSQVPGPALPDPEDDFTSELPDELLQAIGGVSTDEPADVDIGSPEPNAYDRFAADDLLPEGFVLNDRYEIVALAHSGGMGHVYKAADSKNSVLGGDRFVAIKMLRASVAAGTAAGDVLAREATRVQALNHPNVIKIFDFDQHDGHFFLVMEWLDGESLNALLKRTSGRQLEPELVWPFIEATAAALQHAHDSDIVHADVNPSNIFVTRDGQVKLLDFGVARDGEDVGVTSRPRVAWVTQSYSSPEVLSGKPPVIEDDIFSLACVAYRLLAGRHPFNGSPSLLAQNKGVTVQPVAGLPEPQWAVLRSALAYSRQDRPGNAGVFVRAETAPREQARTASDRETVRRGPRWMAGAAVAASIILAVYWAGTKSDRAQAPPAEPAGQVAGFAAPAERQLDMLLRAADEAFENGALVEAWDGAAGARGLYREALALEPGNAQALRGLRSISDIYVQRASDALDNGNPIEATASLAVAHETDPGNPAIEFVDALLIAQGDRLLADARLAAAESDATRAASLLAAVEPFEHIDPADIADIRNTLAAEARDALFLQRLDTADTHMAAGRLTQPENQSALELLLGLHGERPGDLRVLGSMERLGQRLLTRAGFATAAGRFAEAAGALDAVERLGVLGAEIDTARAALQVAIIADASADTVAEEGDLPMVTADAGATSAAVAIGGIGETPIPAAVDTANDLAATDDPDAALGEQRRRSLAELGIRRYVPPVFPRSAQRRGMNGHVEVAFTINPDGSTRSFQVVEAVPGDVFEASAVDAVRQWQFEPREEPMSASVTLRFEMAP